MTITTNEIKKEIVLLRDKGVQRVKVELELDFDGPISDVEQIMSNVVEGLEYQANNLGLAPDEEASVTTKIKATFVSNEKINEILL
ncbi:hypothetical protein MZM54_02645 [[Brevibacterium] frigoritolerans]|nr:hypothetical protein [Peribacillus frigoritolerans]